MFSWAVFNSIFQSNITALMCAHQPQHSALPANVRRCAGPQTPLTQSRAPFGNGDLFVWKCFCGESPHHRESKSKPQRVLSAGKQVPKSTHCPMMIIRTFYVPLGNVWRLIPENAHRKSTASTSSLCVGSGGHPGKKIANADLKCSLISSFLSVVGAERTPS